MSFINRIKNFWVHNIEEFLWRKESRNPRLLIESTLRDYAKKQSETRKALTSLVFYKKQLESKLKKANGMIEFYQHKIEEFAKADNDKNALELMAKLDSLSEEKSFIEEQLKKLDLDVKSAQKLENDLKVKMILGREKMEVLSGRVEALRLRKSLKDGLDQISSGTRTWNVNSQIEKLEKEVYKLELENSDFSEVQDLESDYQSWQGRQVLNSRQQRLNQIKEKLTVKKIDFVCT